MKRKDPFHKMRKDAEKATLSVQKWARENRKVFDRLFQKTSGEMEEEDVQQKETQRDGTTHK